MLRAASRSFHGTPRLAGFMFLGINAVRMENVMAGYVAITIGLIWISFSKPLSTFAVQYEEWWGWTLMSATGWRITLTLMGIAACSFGTLVVMGVIQTR